MKKNVKKMGLTAFVILIVISIAGCGVNKVPVKTLNPSLYQEFAECPKDRCWLCANDNFIAVGSGGAWTSKIVDVYDASDLHKLTTINDFDVMEKKYGLKRPMLRPYKSIAPSIKTEIKGKTANITFLGDSNMVSVDLPDGYQNVGAACKLSDNEIATVFVTNDRYLLTIVDLNDSANNRTIKKGSLPYIHRGLGAQVFSLLTSKSQPQWCNSLNVVCGNNEETLLLGVSSLRMACNSTKCEYLEARSNLLIIDFAGNILGEVKSSDKDQFISYGRIQKVATTYCIPRDVDLFGRAKVANSKACLINPETGLISNIENYNLLWDWNKNHFFYSPDDKHFFVK